MSLFTKNDAILQYDKLNNTKKKNRPLYKLINEILDSSNSYNDRVIYNNEIVLYNRYEGYNNDTHQF